MRPGEGLKAAVTSETALDAPRVKKLQGGAPLLVHALSDLLFERRGVAPRPRIMGCEFCGAALVDPIEEPYNLAFIAHLKATPRCMELFSYGMTTLRNEIGVRYHKKPVVDGI